MKKIIVTGARVHNLKNINITIPRDTLTVITGVSGSGKSSLAFDTIFAEGQRRYVESLSAYARQFLQVMEKPDVEAIEGLSPTISIDQKSASHNPRSTVGTVTEIQDYLRLLYARIGKPHCPKHSVRLEAQTTANIVSFLLESLNGGRVSILSPVVIDRRGEYSELFRELAGKGFSRVRVDGAVYDIEEVPLLAKTVKHTIEIVVDRVRIRSDARQRLIESIETACRFADGRLHVLTEENDTPHVFSTRYACPTCGYAPPELEPKLFSFNNPASACPSCDGLGVETFFDPALVVENPELGLAGGAVRGWDRRNPYYYMLIQTVAKHYGFNPESPFKNLPKKIRNIVLYGGSEKLKFVYEVQSGGGKGNQYVKETPFEGIIGNIKRRWQETDSPNIREHLGRYQSSRPCTACHGARLAPAALAVMVGNKGIHNLAGMALDALLVFFNSLKLNTTDAAIAERVIREIKERLGFLVNIGLSYLSLGRAANTLSGGESQRIRLASQIGSGLTGVTYVLDEPSIGLHQRDNSRLLATLKRLRDLKNTVLVVEHDEEAILNADYVLDIGPAAGVHGGQIVAAGTPKKIAAANTLTGKYLRGELSIAVPEKRRQLKSTLTIVNPRGNNLQGGDFSFPLGMFTCVTGVSGSGKSSLVRDILMRAGMRYLHGGGKEPLAHDNIIGWEAIDKLVVIDQSPIGRTPRSNPATYTGTFTAIRDCFAGLPLARERGYGSGRFSFNVAGGRCEKCEGDGVMRIAMHFLPDVFVTCETCLGKRYNRETLEVRYRGKNIADILHMTVDDAAAFFFKHIPAIARRLETLQAVGLGYIALGQSATTLSGGEAQRIKLALELSKKQTSKTLYLLDEPTTGLHFHDINMLLKVLHRLVDAGNTVIVIEHNLDVIKTADWILDLGPSGGDAGGKLIIAGTPEKVAKTRDSLTGQYLKQYLKKKPAKSDARKN